MKIWFAPGSDVPLYRQLETQVILAILSGDLRPGEKLPSTRALARRFAIHPNTVSSAYQQLEREHWVESRRGSGVYVKEQKPEHLSPEQILDVHIAGFFRAVRELNLPVETVRAQVARWLAAPPPDHLLLVEADAKLARILVAELTRCISLPVRVASPDQCRANRKSLEGAVPVCRPSRRLEAQQAVGVGAEVVVLPISSAVAWLTPLVQAASGHLIAIVSGWPEFIDTARTMLLAAGLAGDALVPVNTEHPDWAQRLTAVHSILCDHDTASRPDLPRKPKRFVFPLLAETAVELLRPHEQAAARNREL